MADILNFCYNFNRLMKSTFQFKNQPLLLLFCLGLFIFWSCTAAASTITATQNELEEELKKVEQQIIRYEQELKSTSQTKNTLANKIKQLKNQQTTLNLQIKATTLTIDSLGYKITETEQTIKKNEIQQEKLKDEIAITLRLLHKDETNLFLNILSKPTLSEAYLEASAYLTLVKKINSLVQQTQVLKEQLQKNKDIFFEQQTEASNLLSIKAIQQNSLKSVIGEQSQLLESTKGLEKNYQTILADSKKKATEIKNRIYELFNTGKQINFSQALEIAQWISKATGLRPAFLLAILTQESNLGKNVGTCNRSGDPPEKSWQVIMKPTRDQEPFKTITKELGLDIDTTPVSCPMKDKNGNQSGWGGAMGPAQFIPSTWMSYKDKVSALTGNKPANPWDIRDAFAAAAIKLKADGAKNTEESEWQAAMKYFAGSVNLKYRFYGDNVAILTKNYQEDIDALDK